MMSFGGPVPPRGQRPRRTLGIVSPIVSDQPTEARSPHPILGELVVIPPESEAEAVVARMRHWHSSLRPWDLVECWQSQQIARETIRLERLHQREILLRHDQTLHAGAAWDQQHRDAAEELAGTIGRHPARVLAELRRSMHGCEALARRWEVLLTTLEARGGWTPGLHEQALNLLGVAPEWREAITPLDAPAGADPVAHLRRVAEAEVRRHHDLAAALAPIDSLGREALRLGLGPDTPALAGVRKEERDADRRLAWCRAQFKTGRSEPRPPDRGDLPNVMPSRKREAASPSDRDFASPDASPSNPTNASPTPPDSSDPRRPPRASPDAPSRRRRRA